MKTIIFHNVYIKDYFVIAGKDEIKNITHYNYVLKDYYCGEKSFEQSEIKLQQLSISNLIKNNNLNDENIDFLIGGDLTSQITASSYAAQKYNISFLGIYSACASFIEGLILASILIDTKKANNIITSVSSHALASERQFRYPIEYGHSRPMTSTVTATGSISTLITQNKSPIKIISGTVGKVINMDIKDVNHMGAVMAPACANTLYNHLKNTNHCLKDYDLILTGDLGKVGVEILKRYYEKVYHQKIDNIQDAGTILYDNMTNKYSGGSGPCCLPLIFFGNIIPKKRYKKILLLGTGAMHSSVLVNQKVSIPAISHALDIEVIL